MMKTSVLLLIIFIKSISTTLFESYYWRDFEGGLIPRDAFVGGKDETGKNVYIGQAFFTDEKDHPTHISSLSVVEIHEGVQEVKVLFGKVYRTRKYIKILCSNASVTQFSWFSTTAKTLNLDLIGKHPVFGGHEGYSIDFPYYIGRTSHVGAIKIGRIAPTGKSKYLFFINGDDKEQSASAYQVLLHDIIKTDDNNDYTTTTIPPFNITTTTTKTITTTTTPPPN